MSPDLASNASTRRPSRIWALVSILFLFVTVAGIVVALVRYEPARAIEIHLRGGQDLSGDIQISGAVTNPGIYPFTADDTIGGLLQAAGGPSKENVGITLNLNSGIQDTPQKININRAESWLLEALPGIGTTRARTIIAYREANGFFKHTTDLMKVDGIGQALYDQIKDLITVSE